MRRGTRVGQAYVAVTADGSGINEEIVDAVDEAGPGVDEAGDRHGRRYGDHFSDGFFARLRDKFSKRLASELGNSLDKSGNSAGERMGDSMGSALVQRLRQRLEEADDVVVRLSERLDKAVEGRTTVKKLSIMENQLRTSERAAERLERQLTKVMAAEGLLGAGFLVNGRRDRGGIADLVGRMFGQGSRNNFLNILGKGMRNIVNLMEKAYEFSTGFSKGMQGAAEGASLFQRLSAGFSGGSQAAGLSKGLGGIAASGPAAAVAIGAVVIAMTVMASVAGALLAILTALTATIVSGLVGALAVAGGALAAVTAGAGLLTAAFMSMTDAQQNLLKKAFLPLKAEMVGIGQIMLHDMVPAFSTWSANLQRALLQAVPVAQVMGKAFAEAGDTLTRSFSGPGFQMFAQSLATYLPSIVNRLASALGGFLNGLLGIFAALMPYVNQFAGYLAQVADRFSRWATSTQGQNAIVDFVGRAVTSLKSLWDFVTEFTGFLAKVLFSPEAQKAGNTIFDSLARTFENFTNKIAQAQADGSLQRWFDDAIKFGSQLWGVIESLGATFITLYNSGVLEAVGRNFETLSNFINAANVVIGPMISLFGSSLPYAMMAVLAPLNAVAAAVIAIGEAVEWALGLIGQGNGAEWSSIPNPLGSSGSGGTAPQTVIPGTVLSPKSPTISLPSLIGSGTLALNATSLSGGGFKPPKKWKNPWKKWAESLIKEGPSIAAQIRNAILSVNRQAAAGILAASRSSDSGDVQASLQNLASSIQTSATQTVNTAQSALNNAAMSLANATSKGAAKKALAQVKKAQKDLAAALKNQKKINAAAKILNAQRVVSGNRVTALLQGLTVQNATLADYAAARARVAERLEAANKQLTEAITLRDDYRTQVADSIKSFGSLLTAQASVIDGVEQSLTATDITSNLQDRLDKIKKFQNDLKLLLAQGLSNDAYKQIVDAGVEQGTTIADALLAGGNAAIQSTNSLVGQINSIADTLGSETSSRLYQAGVDAAQGLVDGLTSLSAQLDAAALRLGTSIALAVKKALGISSPSRVLRALMGDVGDGMVLGLGDQTVKVGTAASTLARQVGISPASTYSSSKSTDAEVSGNGKDPRFRDLIVQTPTENPKAVALEVLNEVTGRL